ncbi:SurA N-terminal domain-containing protein [Gudongella sp. SC589]|uniref:SurA N-terminal domain-containing protein n=1 Tax=Gudongella sp. SC589 TaxID=3385990 RepID=UPI003904AF47
MLRKSSKLIIALSLVLVLSACSGGNETGNGTFELGDPIARVNGVDLHQGPYERAVERMIAGYQQQGLSLEGEMGDQVKERINEQVLNQMIQVEVMTQEAQNLGLAPSESVVQAEIDAFRDHYGSEEDYLTALSDNLYSEDDFRRIILEDLSVKALFDEYVGEVTVTEKEVEDYYLELVQEAQDQIDARKAAGEEVTKEQMAMMAPPLFEEIRDDLTNQLIQLKTQEKQMDYLNGLMEKSEIEILIEK